MHHLLLPGEGALCYFVLHFQNKASWFSKGMQRDQRKHSQVHSAKSTKKSPAGDMSLKKKRKNLEKKKT